MSDHTIDEAVIHGFLAAEEIITISVLFDFLKALAAHLRHGAVENLLHEMDLPGFDFDVAGLPLRCPA